MSHRNCCKSFSSYYNIFAVHDLKMSHGTSMFIASTSTNICSYCVGFFDKTDTVQHLAWLFLKCLSEYSACFTALLSRITSEMTTERMIEQTSWRTGIQANIYAGTSVSLCVCSCVCLRVENWMTAHLSLQSHSIALEWHCRWMSLKCFSEDANSPTQTDAKCRYELYLPNIGDPGCTSSSILIGKYLISKR